MCWGLACLPVASASQRAGQGWVGLCSGPAGLPPAGLWERVAHLWGPPSQEALGPLRCLQVGRELLWPAGEAVLSPTTSAAALTPGSLRQLQRLVQDLWLLVAAWGVPVGG